MKCPVCGFITDPARDLCSRCFADLRDQKRELGLPVMNAVASYQELLSKKVRIIESPKNQQQVSRRSWGQIFGFKRKIAEPEAPLSAPQSENSYVPEEQSFDDALSKSDEPSESAVQRQAEGQKLKLSKRQKEQMLGLLRRRQTGQEAADRENELAESVVLSAPEKLSRFDAGLNQLAPEEAKLWDNSYQQLGLLSARVSSNSSIHLSSLLGSEAAAAISVNYRLAFEELSSPHHRRNFVEALGERKVESIESKELEKAVGAYQRDLERAVSADPLREQIASRFSTGVPASLQIRFLSWLIDFSISAFFSLLFSGLYHLYKSGLFSGLLLGEADLSLVDALSVMIYFVPLLLILLLVVMPLLRSFLGCTAGEFISRLRLCPDSSLKVETARSFLWSMMSIMAVFSLGLLERRNKADLLWRENIVGVKMLRIPAVRPNIP